MMKETVICIAGYIFFCNFWLITSKMQFLLFGLPLVQYILQLVMIWLIKLLVSSVFWAFLLDFEFGILITSGNFTVWFSKREILFLKNISSKKATFSLECGLKSIKRFFLNHVFVCFSFSGSESRGKLVHICRSLFSAVKIPELNSRRPWVHISEGGENTIS